MSGPTVLTVLLNWRTADMTLRAADSAERAMEGIDGGIVVVDNDSGDGSFEKMSAALQDRPRFRVVQSGQARRARRWSRIPETLSSASERHSGPPSSRIRA